MATKAVRRRKQRVSPPIDSTFEKSVASLANDGKKLAAIYSALAIEKVRFAERFNELWEEAKSLDKSENGMHHKFLIAAMNDAIGTDNKSIRSKWIAIGQQAQKLLPLASNLPTQRDGLYEVTRLIDEGANVKKLCAQSQITSESTVREVHLLRSPKQKKKTSRKAKLPSNTAAVTLLFSSYGDAANTLQAVISTNGSFDIQSDKAFYEQLRSLLDAASYEKVKARFR